VELLAISAVVGFVLLLALGPSRPVVTFALTIQDGKVRLIQGKVCQAFVDEAQAIVTDCGITSGEINGVRKRQMVGLTFSPHIPARYHQRFRNVWALHGTPVRPVASGNRQRQYLLSCLAMVVLAGAVQAQEVAPAPAAQTAQDKDRRLTAAIQQIRDALKDLPAGGDVDQIKRALDRIQKRVLEELEGRIAIATADVEQWAERSAWSARMLARGYMTRAQAEADKARLQAAALTLSRLQEQRRSLVPEMKPPARD
jgi:hypothetical protein